MPNHIIAIANCKGGTGKTTTAVNVSAELAHRGRRVLLVDLDPQGHSGFGLGVFAHPGAAAAHHVFGDRAGQIADAIRPSAIERLDVLPADRGFKLRSAADDPMGLARALAGLGDRYDIVVVDTPPSPDLPLVAALVSAQSVLIPMQLHHLAHDGLQQFSRLFFNVATSLNPALKHFAIVPIQVDMRMHLQRLVLAKLLRDFGPERIFRGIRSDIALAEAFGSACPIRIYRPTARGAVDYNLLATDVLGFWFS